MMKYKVIHHALLIYGLRCKACVRFNVGQEWKLIRIIDVDGVDKLYVLERGNVQVHVGKDDVKQFFEEVQE